MSSDDSFINRYRPQTFDQVYGHAATMSLLIKAMQTASRPHTYLITGPPGIGKTSIARLIGTFLDAEIIELDAASHSGVDDMRELVELSQYISLQGDGTRVYIIDECHTLSRNAWQALLKLTEEPPDHCYVVLCTTDPAKVPNTIKNQRAYSVVLKALPFNVMEQYVDDICQAEGWDVNRDVFNAVIANAEGLPRKALMILLAVHDVADREAVRQIITTMDAGEPVSQICQMLLQGKASWVTVRPLLAKVEDDQFEGALVHTVRYMIGAMMRASDDRQTQRLNEYIQALTFPSETFDSKARFFAAIGRCIFK